MALASEGSDDPRLELDTWAEVYDLAGADRTPEFRFYTGLVEAQTRSVLELGCGTGTVLREVLARLRAAGAAQVRGVGIDFSDRMLSVARRHAPDVEWICGDMRSPAVEGPFDLVFSCYNTLQSLPTEADLGQTFSAVRRLLAPAGRFAFDIYQPNIPYIRDPVHDRVARAIIAPDGRHLEIREDTQFDASSQILRIDWRLVERDPAHRQIASACYRLRQFHSTQIDSLLERAGLLVRERYGDLDRSPFTPTSKKQVLVCQAARDSD
jgi:SAM-dependent methyltransferase